MSACGAEPASGRRGRRVPPVCDLEPLRELAGSFVRRLAVEGHHRGRHSWQPAELGTPSTADGRNLDLVGTTTYGLFEAMYGHVCCCPKGGQNRGTILRSRHTQSSEGEREGYVNNGPVCWRAGEDCP